MALAAVIAAALPLVVPAQDDGFAELMDVAGSHDASAAQCAAGSLERDVASAEAALLRREGAGCRVLDEQADLAAKIAGRVDGCGDAARGSRMRAVLVSWEEVRAQRCSAGAGALSQALGVASAGIDVELAREEKKRRKAEAERRRQRMQKYMAPGVDPNTLPVDASALENWKPVTTTVHDGAPALRICIRDHECEDGDILNVWLNGRPVLADEMFNEATCTVEAVSPGINRIQVYAPNGTGFKGDCGHQDVNTGEITVSGVDEAGAPTSTQTQNWRLRSRAGTRTEIPVIVK